MWRDFLGQKRPQLCATNLHARTARTRTSCSSWMAGTSRLVCQCSRARSRSSSKRLQPRRMPCFVLRAHILTNLHVASRYWERLRYTCQHMQQAVREYCCAYPYVHLQPSRPCQQGEEDWLETEAEYEQRMKESSRPSPHGLLYFPTAGC